MHADRTGGRSPAAPTDRRPGAPCPPAEPSSDDSEEPMVMDGPFIETKELILFSLK